MQEITPAMNTTPKAADDNEKAPILNVEWLSFVRESILFCACSTLFVNYMKVSLTKTHLVINSNK